jgi:hypothetical protein
MASFRKVVGSDCDAFSLVLKRVPHTILQDFLEQWPAEIKFTANVSKRLEDTPRNLSKNRQVKSSVHTFIDEYFGWVCQAVFPSLELGFLGGVFFASTRIKIKRIFSDIGCDDSTSSYWHSSFPFLKINYIGRTVATVGDDNTPNF